MRVNILYVRVMQSLLQYCALVGMALFEAGAKAIF